MATGKFKTSIASPDHRDGLVVYLSRETKGSSADLFEFYYINKKIKIEIYQNGEDWFSVDLDVFKSAFAEAEDKIRNKVLPY